MTDRILAHYRIETALDLFQAAAIMAGEQSAGTFVKVPGETPELLDRHGARVEAITPLDVVNSPSLPGSKPPAQQRRRISARSALSRFRSRTSARR